MAATDQFVITNRKQNRNFRMSWDVDEGLRRAAMDHTADNNVSLVFRMIMDGSLPNLTQLGYLCAEHRQIDCPEHNVEKPSVEKPKRASRKKEPAVAAT